MCCETLAPACFYWETRSAHNKINSHWNAVSIMVVGALFAPFLVLYFFPETSGRELEEISPEKPA